MDKLTVVKYKAKCKFCGLQQNDPIRYGVMYKLGNIVAHYFCVLLSTSLVQNGKDEEGMLGFLYSDIQKELKRTSQILCFYCNTENGTIRCCHKGCRKYFHYPCGIKKGTLSQFKDHFKSFCHKHRPVQAIPKHILQEAYKVKITCCICYELVNVKNKRSLLWAPCCLKNWFHMYCIQKLAWNAGYFFRCPACNDVQKFSNCVQEFGIFIPQQDASWELVPNAYVELQFRYNKCDAKVCLCPLGREGNKEDTTWEIILCQSCGSQGIHAACAGLKHLNSEWECFDCQKITGRFKLTSKASSGHKSAEGSSETLKLPVIHQKKRCRGSEDLENLVLDKRKKCKQEVQEEEEIEVDVVTVDEETKDNKTKILGVVNESTGACKDLNGEVTEVISPDTQEVLTLIRPGPLSYKLGLIRNALKNSQTSLVTSVQEKKEKPANLIVLTDSEEETETDDDIEIIEVGKGTPEKRPPLNSPKRWNSETTDPISNQREKAYNSVFFSNDFPKSAELSLSLSDFDILAVMRVHSSGDEKDEDPVNALNKFSQQTEGAEGCEKYLSVYPVARNKSLPWYTEKVSCLGIQGKLIETDTIIKHGLVQFINDGVEFYCRLPTMK